MADDQTAQSESADAPIGDNLGQAINMLAPGWKVFGRYTLEACVGRGEMSVVWRAHDELLDESVALKFMAEIVVQDAAAVDDLRQKTARVRWLTHPHIVRVNDFMRNNTLAVVSMEFVGGETLEQRWLKQPGRVFSAGALAPLIEQLCPALDYAHQVAKVVHRGLKPSNVLVTPEGVAKITDFGIGNSLAEARLRLMGGVERNQEAIAFMSPQQLDGNPPSAADDIYALGAMLHQLLAGRPPFATGDVALQIRTQEPMPMESCRVESGVVGEPIPQAWENAVAACLAKEPAQRPSSGEEIMCLLDLSGRKPAPGSRSPLSAAAKAQVSAPVVEQTLPAEEPAVSASAPEVEPAPAPVETAPVVEQVAPVEEPEPAVQIPVSAPEAEPAPVPVEAAPVVEQTLPAEEPAVPASAPEVEPAPAPVETAPVVEQVAPVEEPEPAAQIPVSAPEAEPAPVPVEAAPVVEQTLPAEEPAVPASAPEVEPAPVPAEAAPVVEQVAPVEEPEPAVQVPVSAPEAEPAPVPVEAAPVVEKTLPAGEPAVPAGAPEVEPAPAPVEAAPVVEQVAPVEEPEPAVQVPVSASEAEPAPVPAEAAPVVEQTLPAEEPAVPAGDPEVKPAPAPVEAAPVVEQVAPVEEPEPAVQVPVSAPEAEPAPVPAEAAPVVEKTLPAGEPAVPAGAPEVKPAPAPVETAPVVVKTSPVTGSAAPASSVPFVAPGQSGRDLNAEAAPKAAPLVPPSKPAERPAPPKKRSLIHYPTPEEVEREATEQKVAPARLSEPTPLSALADEAARTVPAAPASSETNAVKSVPPKAGHPAQASKPRERTGPQKKRSLIHYPTPEEAEQEAREGETNEQSGTGGKGKRSWVNRALTGFFGH